MILNSVVTASKTSHLRVTKDFVLTLIFGTRVLNLVMAVIGIIRVGRSSRESDYHCLLELREDLVRRHRAR
jgi:hypothetical protein